MRYLLLILIFLVVGEVQANSLTLTLGGISLHGLRQGDYSRKIMENKLTSNGRVAYNPQLGLIYKTDNWQFSGIFLQDCYGKAAGELSVGPKIEFLKFFSVGSVLGVYVRQALPPNPDNPTEAASDFIFLKKIKNLEVMPLAGLTFSFEVPIAKNVAIESNTIFNFFVNHSNIGLKFKF